MKRFIHRPEGFTLIELMIVILIIAILVAIAVPVFLNSRDNARQRTCQANLRTIDGAVMSYQADEQVYPGTIADMVAEDTKALKSEPKCPSGAGGTYVFLTASDPPRASCPFVADHTI